jgi:hypothetical protein
MIDSFRLAWSGLLLDDAFQLSQEQIPDVYKKYGVICCTCFHILHALLHALFAWMMEFRACTRAFAITASVNTRDTLFHIFIKIK